MPVLPVPLGATPGVLDNTTLLDLNSVCDIGSLMGTLDGTVSAWIQLCIVPFGSVSPDAWGRFLHVCLEFVQPAEWIGARRRQVPGLSYDTNPTPMRIECDPGWFRIWSPARVYATGGVAGDKYLITMTAGTERQESDTRLRAGDPPFYQVDVSEPACRFRLTANSLATFAAPSVSLPGFAIHHSIFRVVSGTGSWGGNALTGASKWLPLNAPITTGVNTIYQTGGGV
jgi:hypothetical protein